MKKKLAFSLLEISIVLLVVSILLIGITKGRQVVTKFDVLNAAKLTKSSVVGKIDGLSLWLETTSSDSIDRIEASDGHLVSSWNDISDNSFTTNNAIQETPAFQPRYITNVINGLPILRFDIFLDPEGLLDPNVDFLSFSAVPDVVNTNYTIFIVAARRSDEAINMIIGGTSGDDNSNLHVGYNGNSFDVAHLGQTTANKDYIGFGVPVYDSPIFQIHSVTFNSSYGKEYYNNGGVEQASPLLPIFSARAISSQARDPLIGWVGASIGRREGDFFNGDIAEIIMYNKSLTSIDRHSVEQYLSQKWGIEITQ
ncbi:MAG: type II secretory pathway pseudopilin PulG [Rickettsiales bacterium]|jgi:type II secretory pathway pseudopilin PulG